MGETRVAAERDLYRSLLDLAEADDPQLFLGEACGLLMRASAASAGLIAMFDGDRMVWSTAAGLDDTGQRSVLDHVSTGVLSAVRQQRKAVVTSSALLDARFGRRESVRRNQIEAVLCSPITLEPDIVGVVYLQKSAGSGPFEPEVVQLVERVCERLTRLGRHLEYRVEDPTLPLREKLVDCELVGRSPAMATLLRQVVAAAELEMDVLITGPTGTGKNDVARLVHRNSARSRGALVHVNCPAIPTELFEAEVFGARAGAYTGATRDRRGLVEEATGGTLFLDEVAELPLTTQAKLLQLIQERTYHRVGDPQIRRGDFRVIAATHQDLDALVKAGRFRADLRYRLEVFPIRVPGLDDRRSDVRLLAEHTIERVRRRHPVLGSMQLTERAMRALCHAEWPGNVRQLAHHVEAAMVRAHANGRVEVDVHGLFAPRAGERPTWQAATHAYQRQLLEQALAEEGGSIPRAAERLDLARSRAYELVKLFGLRDD